MYGIHPGPINDGDNDYGNSQILVFYIIVVRYNNYVLIY